MSGFPEDPPRVGMILRLTGFTPPVGLGPLERRGELVPKPVEVNPFASRDEPLHIRTAEAEMPEQRVLENVLPRANTRQRRVN
jgi:hypothetical protein